MCFVFFVWLHCSCRYPPHIYFSFIAQKKIHGSRKSNGPIFLKHAVQKTDTYIISVKCSHVYLFGKISLVETRLEKDSGSRISACFSSFFWGSRCTLAALTVSYFLGLNLRPRTLGCTFCVMLHSTTSFFSFSGYAVYRMKSSSSVFKNTRQTYLHSVYKTLFPSI